MTKIELEIHDDAIATIGKIKNINDSGVELVIPEGSALFDNILNLKLVEQQAEKRGISIQFSTNDENGNTLISMLEGKPEISFSQEEVGEERQIPIKRENFKLPKISVKLPVIKFGGKHRLLLLILPVILVILGVVVFIGTRAQKAQAKIVLASLPLTRSIPVKVKVGIATNPVTSLLKGVGVETTTEENMEAATTGETLIGEKAKGKITLYNKTDSEISLKKGVELTYKTSGSDLNFSLDSDVTIPAREPSTSDPGSPIIPGEKESSLTAQDIGDNYNIDKSKSLEVAKYKKSSLEGKSRETFSGGKSEKVKVVAAADKTNLSKSLLAQNTSGAEMALKSKLGASQKLIAGSTKTTISKETFNHEVGDKAEKLTLNQTVSIAGLSYLDSELNDLLDKLIFKLVPEGYSLSKKDWGVNIEILGNATNSVLSPTEADLQVTLKTSMIPNIDKDKIKKDLAGKTPADAQKYLGSIKNIKSYELFVSPPLPFLRKVPKDTNQIDLMIENE